MLLLINCSSFSTSSLISSCVFSLLLGNAIIKTQIRTCPLTQHPLNSRNTWAKYCFPYILRLRVILCLAVKQLWHWMIGGWESVRDQNKYHLAQNNFGFSLWNKYLIDWIRLTNRVIYMLPEVCTVFVLGLKHAKEVLSKGIKSYRTGNITNSKCKPLKETPSTFHRLDCINQYLADGK